MSRPAPGVDVGLYRSLARGLCTNASKAGKVAYFSAMGRIRCRDAIALRADIRMKGQAEVRSHDLLERCNKRCEVTCFRSRGSYLAFSDAAKHYSAIVSAAPKCGIFAIVANGVLDPTLGVVAPVKRRGIPRISSARVVRRCEGQRPLQEHSP
jgi:hypothetical protein